MQKMKVAVSAAILSVCLGATISVPTTSSANVIQYRPSGLHDLKPGFQDRLEAAYTKQTGRVKTKCFPRELKAALSGLEKRFGRDVVVTSGYRPKAGRSQHAKCRAADIRIKGVKPSLIASYARKMKGIGGVGTYCRNGIVHIDVGPKRSWRHC